MMIQFKGVTKSFNDDIVLNQIDLAVATGETKIILGVSGSGKSTILKLILGLIQPDAGQILVDGQDITHMSERELVRVRRDIGMVFQEGALFDSLTVRENVGYRLYEESEMSEEEIEQVVLKVLGFVGLEDAIDKMPAELSGGMKRRAGLARALVGNPKTILYDEPTAGLDPLTKQSIVDLMIKLRDIEGVTSVFVTHDLRAARLIATEYAVVKPGVGVRVLSCDDDLCLLNINFVMLRQGELAFEGSLQELMTSEDSYIRRFVI